MNYSLMSQQIIKRFCEECGKKSANMSCLGNINSANTKFSTQDTEQAMEPIGISLIVFAGQITTKEESDHPQHMCQYGDDQGPQGNCQLKKERPF